MIDTKIDKDKQIICKYKIDKSNEVRIFGDKFVENNKKICKIIYDGKELELTGIFSIKDVKDNILEIRLKGIDNITNAGYMFYNCTSLLSCENINNWNTTNINDMNSLFYNCMSLLSLPDISKWKTHKVIDMSYLFYNCSSLSQLPDISKWNIENTKDMSYIFSYCKSLKNLPDISKWNIENINNIRHTLKNLFFFIITYY